MERKGKKIIDNFENQNLNQEPDDLKFILWKAELNKELLSFWKTFIDKE